MFILTSSNREIFEMTIVLFVDLFITTRRNIHALRFKCQNVRTFKIWEFYFSGLGEKPSYPQKKKKKNFSQQARETKERFRATFTANSKLQIQVENFSRIGNEQIKTIQKQFLSIKLT